jgi:ACR3 family arsenite transporter
VNIFERYLTLWVLLCIVAGIALGELFPAVFQQIARMEVAAVNIPVGLLIWVMIVPMLIRVDFGALLATLVLLFAFQGRAILAQPLVIALLAVPILLQVVFNASLAYWLNRQLGESHDVAGPSALIGASNFFELAVATAISLFGIESGAALATVVGVLIEVPVMLLVVRAVNHSRHWYSASSKAGNSV